MYTVTLTLCYRVDDKINVFLGNTHWPKPESEITENNCGVSAPLANAVSKCVSAFVDSLHTAGIKGELAKFELK